MTVQPPKSSPLSSPRPQTPGWESTLMLSLVTAPVLLGLLSGRAIAEALTQLGLASEELFRGDRLPTLSNSNADSPPPA